MSHLNTTQSTSTYQHQVSYDPMEYKQQRNLKIQWQIYTGIALACLIIIAVNSLARFDVTMIFVTAILCIPAAAAGTLYVGVKRAYSAIKVKYDFIRKTRLFLDDWMRNVATQVHSTPSPFNLSVEMASRHPGVYNVELENASDPAFRTMKFVVGPVFVGTIDGSGPDARMVFGRLQRVLLGKDADGSDAKALNELFARVEPQPDLEMSETRSLQGD